MGSCKLRSVRVHSRGLTLAELLVFLALAALLSALGMYGLARYLRHSRTAEAVGSLNTLGANAATATLQSGCTLKVPAIVGRRGGGRQVVSGGWSRSRAREW